MPPPHIDADLHSHSRVSDGTLTPRELVRRAHASGVQLFSLTDHDHLGGIAEARTEAQRLGLAFVAGVEVSVSWGGETIHVVGLRVDPANRALSDGLALTRSGRDERARAMGEALAAAGIEGAYEGALRHVSNPALVGRTHFARFLVEQRVCGDLREVFRRYLVEGKPGFVAHRWASLDDAVGWILEAGGVAVLAHPARYRLDANGLDALIGEFRALGGSAIEVVCGSHTREDQRRFAAIASARELLASRGSDFHGPDENRIDFGQLPPLPEGLVPVWCDWPEASRAPSQSASAIGA
ncbi:MAG TPA: 3',5'-nucleoside bisphosphate phosphatase [Zeimonas sp.]